jgi:hypothetical protein
MIWKKIVFLPFIVGIGCASYTNPKNNLSRDEMETTHSFATMNGQIWGDYGLEHDEYTKFNQDDYERILRKSKSDTASEATTFYESLLKKEIHATKLSYVICGYSDKYRLAFCDDAACEKIEQITNADSEKEILMLKDKIINPGHCQ